MVEVAFQSLKLDIPTITTLFLLMLIFLVGLFFRFWFFPNRKDLDRIETNNKKDLEKIALHFKKDLEKIDIHLKYLGKRMDSVHELLANKT